MTSEALMKSVIDDDTDEILGAALLCIDARELINLVALSIRHGITAAELRDTIYTHPSCTEDSLKSAPDHRLTPPHPTESRTP
jgi:pyruvate/2-oxoglutarate dehydrogenase complex dihydrolipoamide dehydrogenase (E3) component